MATRELPSGRRRVWGLEQQRVQAGTVEKGVSTYQKADLPLTHCRFKWGRFLPRDTGGSDGKESACNARNPGLMPGLGRSPGEGNGNPLQYPCLENPMDRGAWGGYNPWGHREPDTTERLTFPH